MNTLHQILLMCRAGFESECAAEIMDHAAAAEFPAYIKAEAGSGFVILVSAAGDDTTDLLQAIDFNTLIFTRQWFACGDQISQLPQQDRTTPLCDIARQIAAQLAGGFNAVELSYADTNQGKELSRFCKAFSPHLLAALNKRKLVSAKSRLRLHVFFVDSTTAWLGISPLDNSAYDAMGIPRLRMPAAAPSRSTLKLEEAIHCFFDKTQQSTWFKPGMRAVDLGAAPGGWSWQLVKRGLLVTAVDNGPMDEALMKSGMVEHIRSDAFTYAPEHRIDWLVCDMAERPLHVSRLVARWFTRGYCRAAIFNLKLPMKKRYPSVLECRELLHKELNKASIRHSIRIKQLYHDREEVSVCLLPAREE